VVFLGSKGWYRDRLVVGFKRVWSGEKSGRRPAKGSPEKTTCVHRTRWPHAQVHEWTFFGRVKGRKIWEKLIKILENYSLGVCAKIFEVGLSGVLVFAPNSLILHEMLFYMMH